MADQQDQRPRLTVAAIVRNEEQTLAGTLESVRDVADEIVICDTGSTDATASVAARFATRVLKYDWHDDFAAARNACLEHVTGDWILWLDAGERIAPQDASGLRRFIDSAPDRSTAFMLLVKVPPPNPHVSAEQIAQIRLVPNYPGIRFQGRVRETLIESLDEAGISVEGLRCDIHRGKREHDAKVKAFRARRNLQLCELASQEDGPHPRWLSGQAEAHANLGNHTQAAKLFRQAVKSAEPGSVDMLQAYYGLLTALDGVSDADAARISVCLEALEVYPLDAQLLCAMGGYLQNQRRLDLALRSYETAYRSGQVNPQTWHLQEIAPLAAVCYSRALQLSGRDEEALAVLVETTRQNPDSSGVQRQLLDFHVQHGHTDKALAQLDAWPTPLPDIEILRTAVKGACLAGQENWVTGRSYLEAAYSAGCRDPICLKWLSLTLMSLGDASQAEAVLQEWADVEPANPQAERLLATLTTAGTRPTVQQKGQTPATDQTGADVSMAHPDRFLRIDAPGPAILRQQPSVRSRNPG
jgi:tetratricopeptide (TPR) repeat protein